MAGAIISGLLESGECVPADLGVCEISERRRGFLATAFAIRVSADAAEITAGAGVVFIAVKPQVLDEVLGTLAPLISSETLIISIVAGKTLTQIEAHFQNPKVVRVMPNLAASVRASMNVYCCNARVSGADREDAIRLLSSFGNVQEAQEALFDAVTAVSGSGPAFVAHLVGGLRDAGLAQGLAPAQASLLALQTFLGTARVLLEGDETPEELIQSVSSPNGTTVAGMQVLSASDVHSVLAETVSAAARRSRELRTG